MIEQVNNKISIQFYFQILIYLFVYDIYYLYILLYYTVGRYMYTKINIEIKNDTQFVYYNIKK